MQLVEEEFFAQRLPEIATLAGAARKQAIEELERSRSIVFEEFCLEGTVWSPATSSAEPQGGLPSPRAVE